MERGQIILIVLVAIYFLPTVCALLKWRVNTFAIFVLNLLSGWTVLGWVGSLVWALTEGRRE